MSKVSPFMIQQTEYGPMTWAGDLVSGVMFRVQVREFDEHGNIIMNLIPGPVLFEATAACRGKDDVGIEHEFRCNTPVYLVEDVKA